ncbi:hypothetical protein SOVF_213390, partial [Spinacia oleracea]
MSSSLLIRYNNVEESYSSLYFISI